MLTYLVLCGRNGAPVDDALIQRFSALLPDQVPILPDEQIVWRSRDRRCVFLGWQVAAEVAGIGSHWLADERGLTAFTGSCWPADSGWVHGTNRSWARQLRDWLEPGRPVPALREALFGHFTLVSLTPDGNGWILPDFASIDQLFTSEDDQVLAISNRAGLCARAVTHPSATPGRSPLGAGWLVCDGWILDEETGYWDVQRPRTGSYVSIDSATGARIVEPSRPVFLQPDPHQLHASYAELLEEVERDLRLSLRTIAALPLSDRVLSLSGGKDSRTLTALALSEGLQDRFRFVTQGAPDSSEALAARQVADRYRLDWTLTDLSARSPEQEETSVRQHLALREGLNASWSSLDAHTLQPGAIVSGVLGEALRWGPVSMTGVGVTEVDELIRRVDRQRPVDRLGLLRTDYRAYYQQTRADLIRAVAAHGEPLGTASTVFYHEGLAQSRNGPDYTWTTSLRFDPFITPVCMRASHRLPVEGRPDIRFHLDLQRRCDIGLSKLPFADSVWSEASYAQLPDAADYRAIPPMRSASPAGMPWRVKRYADLLPILQRFLLDPDNPIQELLDQQRVLRALATGAEHGGRTRLIWAALSAAVWLGGHETPVRLARATPPR